MLQMQNPGYVDRNTIKTFAESTAVILAVSIALRRAFRINHPVVPFILSLLLSFGLAISDGTKHDFWTWVLAFVNGCIMYCAVIGANETVVDFATAKPAGEGKPHGRPPAKFLASYFGSSSPPPPS
jgi:hypothetical protein